MIKIIGNEKSQDGYVVEEENYSKVALVYYKKRGNAFVPDLMETYLKSEIFELQTEAEMRKLFENYIKPTEELFFREEVSYLIPLG